MIGKDIQRSAVRRASIAIWNRKTHFSEGDNMTKKRVSGRRLSRIVLLHMVAGALVAAGSALAAPPAKVSGNVPINTPQQAFPQDNPSRNTSSITASDNGLDLLVGFEDLQGLCGATGGLSCPPLANPGYVNYSFSVDGGTTWTQAEGFPAIGTAVTAGHPWVDHLSRPGQSTAARDRDTYFLISRLQDLATTAPLGLGIYRGQFGAGTFTFKDATIVTSPDEANNEYSRQVIVAAKDGSAAVYTVYVNVDEICGVPFAGFGQVEAWNSHDGGDTWNGAAIVSPDGNEIRNPANPFCGDRGQLQIAPDAAIGEHGELYAVWQYGPEFFPDGSNGATDSIGFSSSFDGGKTFTHFKLIAPLNAMRANPPVGYAKNRMNDQPRIAVDTTGSHRGRIYVTYYPAVSPVLVTPATQSVVSSQVYIIHSDDRGATWSDPVALAPPVPPTGLKRIWPTVSVRPDGTVDVVYLESQEVETGTPCSVAFNTGLTRTGPASSLVDTFMVQSRDGGNTWSAPLKISTETSNWCTAPYQFDTASPNDSFFVSNAGDYIGAKSIANKTLAVWPDDRNTFMDTFFGAVTGLLPVPRH
jgi:hypothetical protein